MIEVAEESGVFRITLNRPEKRNALNSALLRELLDALDQAASARVLILSGAGKVFCAGMDLTEADTKELPDLLAQVFSKLYRLPCITVALVQGAALGGGAGLIGACDIVIADEKAKFGFPEVKRGLVPAQVLTFLIRQVGQRRLRELVLLGDLIDASVAKEYGLVTRVASDLALEAERVVASALEAAPVAAKETKRLIDESYPASFDEDLKRGLERFKKESVSEEAKEGVRAFVEQRMPKWQN